MTLNGDWLPVSCTNAAAAAAHNDSEENCHKMTDDVVSRNCVQIHSVCVITLDPIMSESYISVRTSRCWLILFFFFLVALLWWLTRLSNSRRSVLFYFRYSLHYVCCRLFQLHIGRHLCHSRSYSYVSLLKRCSGWTQLQTHSSILNYCITWPNWPTNGRVFFWWFHNPHRVSHWGLAYFLYYRPIFTVTGLLNATLFT